MIRVALIGLVWFLYGVAWDGMVMVQGFCFVVDKA